MSSRKEQKERLRQERLERERAAAAAAGRKRRFQIGGGLAILAVIVAVVVVIVASSGGGSSNSSGNGNANAASSGQTVGDPSGLQTGPAPWPPEYTYLAQRLAAFNFPQQSDVGYHVHAELMVYVNGKQTTVPADVGIDPQGRFISPIHTHDTSGVVHMESTSYYPFTLGEFINIWGVYFTDQQIGGYKAGTGNVLQLWVNGKQIADPVHYKMKPHDVMIVGYGKPGSFPHKKAYTFAQGL